MGLWVPGRMLGPRMLGSRMLGSRMLGSRMLGSRMLGCLMLGSRMLGSRMLRPRLPNRSYLIPLFSQQLDHPFFSSKVAGTYSKEGGFLFG